MSNSNGNSWQKEKTLPSGEIIELTRDPNYPDKPFAVVNWEPGELGDCRWWVNFATLEEAEVEYAKWN